ncbi:MAG: TolC family protein [Pseudomonadota bacterium]
MRRRVQGKSPHNTILTGVGLTCLAITAACGVKTDTHHTLPSVVSAAETKAKPNFAIPASRSRDFHNAELSTGIRPNLTQSSSATISPVKSKLQQNWSKEAGINPGKLRSSIAPNEVNELSLREYNYEVISDNDPETTTVDREITTGSVAKQNVGKENNLGFQSVIQHTISTNPDILIVDAQSEDARIGIEIEKTSFLPTLDLSASTGRENTYSESKIYENIQRDEVSLVLQQTLYDFGARKNAVKRQEVLHKSAQLRKSDTTEQVTFEVLRAYLNYLRESDLVNSSARNVGAHKDIVKLIGVREEGGDATLADVKKAETRLDTANSQKLENQNRLKDSITTFKRMTELDPSKVKRPNYLIRRFNPKVAGNVETAILNNPRLQSISADRESLEYQLKQQKAAMLPELFALGEANFKSNAAGDTGVVEDVKAMVGLRVRLYDGGKKMRTAEQIEARIMEADARHQKAYRELTAELEQNEQTLTTNRDKSKFLSDSLTSAKKVTQLYSQQFESGSRTPFELLDAQRDLYKAEQEVINHRYDSALAGYNAMRIQGNLVAYLSTLPAKK